MHFTADLDQASEGNVLGALSFEKALQTVLEWLHQEQHNFSQYFHNHPSIRKPIETALRGIIDPAPPFSPAETACLEEDESEALSSYSSVHTPQQGELDDTGRHGNEQFYIPYTLNVDRHSGPDNIVDTHHSIQESVHASATLPERERTSTKPEDDTIVTYTPVQAHLEHANDHRHSVELTKAGAEVYTEVEQADHDVDEEEVNNGEFVPHRQVAINSRELLPSASPDPDRRLATETPTLKRKRQIASINKARILKRQLKAKDTIHPTLVPMDITQRVHNIATIDDIIFMRDQLELLSNLTRHHSQGIILQNKNLSRPPLQLLSRRQRLKMLWSCIGDSEVMERWAIVLQKVCQMEFFGQYFKERTRFYEWQSQHKQRRRQRKVACQYLLSQTMEQASPPLHPLAEYVDLCFPKEVEANRVRAKKKFENLVQTKEPWVKFGQRYGKGVFAVTSAALCDEHLRKLGKAQIDLLFDLIDTSMPDLADHLQNLSDLLSFLIEHGRLPPYKLRLEALTRHQLESMRSTEWSLKHLLERHGTREEHATTNLTIENFPPLMIQFPEQTSHNVKLEFGTEIDIDFDAFVNDDGEATPLHTANAPLSFRSDDTSYHSNADRLFLRSPLEQSFNSLLDHI